jgi:hypothetical protein
MSRIPNGYTASEWRAVERALDECFVTPTRYVRTFRVFSRAHELNGLTLETNESGLFRGVNEVVNGHFDELQDSGARIISVQSQDTLLANPGYDEQMLTTYTILYEESES